MSKDTATNGASSIESILKSSYVDVLNFFKILDNIYKLWSDEKGRSALFDKIEEDKNILENICNEINEGKGHASDILFDPNFTLTQALEDTYGPNSKEAKQVTEILNEYDMVEVTDFEKANTFSKKLLNMGIPHTSFQIFKPILDKDGKPVMKNGEMQTVPVTVLITNHAFLKEYEKDVDYRDLLKHAVRVSKVGFNKEERFGYVPEEIFAKENTDARNPSIEIPDPFDMTEFNSKMALANKKYTTKKVGGKETIVVAGNDEGFTRAMIESVHFETNATLPGKYSVLENKAYKESFNTLVNEINQLQQSKDNNSSIYIFNGSDLNNKSYIEIPKNGNAIVYTYHPNDKEHPFHREENEIIFDGNSSAFAKAIFKEGGEITKGLRQGITIWSGPRIVDEKGANLHDGVVSVLQSKYDKKPQKTFVIDPADPEVVHAISMAQEYTNKINNVLNLTNNDNFEYVNKQLENLLVTNALIKVINSLDKDPVKAKALLKASNKTTIKVGNKTFDLETLMGKEKRNELMEQQQSLINDITDVFDDKKRAGELLNNVFNTAFLDKDVEIVEGQPIISDLTTALITVQTFSSSREKLQELDVKDLASGLDRVIEDKAREAFEPDKSDDSRDEKDSTR